MNNYFTQMYMSLMNPIVLVWSVMLFNRVIRLIEKLYSNSFSEREYGLQFGEKLIYILHRFRHTFCECK